MDSALTYRQWRRSRLKAGYRARQQELHNAFSAVMSRYVGNKALPPIASSNPDRTARRYRWHPESAIYCADVERCVRKALHEKPELLRELILFYVFQRALGIQPLMLTVGQTQKHAEIERLCGREFLREGLYPMFRYFRPKSKERLQELEAEYREATHYES